MYTLRLAGATANPRAIELSTTPLPMEVEESALAKEMDRVNSSTDAKAMVTETWEPRLEMEVPSFEGEALMSVRRSPMALPTMAREVEMEKEEVRYRVKELEKPEGKAMAVPLARAEVPPPTPSTEDEQEEATMDMAAPGKFILEKSRGTPIVQYRPVEVDLHSCAPMLTLPAPNT